MQDDVGLRTRRQCEAIVRFLHSWQAKQADQGVTLCVEGNISAGKSTFLNLMKKTMVGQLQQVIEVRDCTWWGCWWGHLNHAAWHCAASSVTHHCSLRHRRQLHEGALEYCCHSRP